MVFCVYVAARVIVQHRATRPDDQAAQSSLEFLVSVMRALKRKHPLAESFLVQLDVDIKHRGMHNSSSHPAFMINQTRFVSITVPSDVIRISH